MARQERTESSLADAALSLQLRIVTLESEVSAARHRIDALADDLARCQGVVRSLAERVASQSEILARLAEKTPG